MIIIWCNHALMFGDFWIFWVALAHGRRELQRWWLETFCAFRNFRHKLGQNSWHSHCLGKFQWCCLEFSMMLPGMFCTTFSTQPHLTRRLECTVHQRLAWNLKINESPFPRGSSSVSIYQLQCLNSLVITNDFPNNSKTHEKPGQPVGISMSTNSEGFLPQGRKRRIKVGSSKLPPVYCIHRNCERSCSQSPRTSLLVVLQGEWRALQHPSTREWSSSRFQVYLGSIYAWWNLWGASGSHSWSCKT